MARPKSEFLSGLGTGFEIFKAIVNATIAAGGGDVELRALIGNTKKLAAIAAIIVQTAGQPMVPTNSLPAHHYEIVVPTAGSPTCVQIAAAYSWTSPLWGTDKYLNQLHASLKDVPRVAGKKICLVKKFDQRTSSEAAIAWGEAHGYRLAFPEEREAFARANPDLQRQFWIVDLGSFAMYGDVVYVPVLSSNAFGRNLVGDTFEHGWHAVNRFLFVRK